MAADPLISVKGLVRAFGATRVLDGVDLDVAPGEAVALLGANGAGKTTVLKILATVLRPTRGTVTIAGHDCARDPDAVRPLVGLVGHGAHVYEELTALENLTFWTTLTARPLAAGALVDALGEVDLDHAAHARVRTFSAGMKRRLALARVRVARPRVLLLDEPFAGLDQRARKWLDGVLEAHRAGGGALVMATHGLARDLAAVDRLAILAGGRVALDTPRAGLGPDDIQRLYAAHAEEWP
ncbi:MAG TPA: heme ABC exporter ATP-binding protein CcmA [Candidatus Tectomicrobia bacterium]|nr:heme ABC exporter ATP-binding protein CcmA [Candidatus Tectomicrobia bacterium]